MKYFLSVPFSSKVDDQGRVLSEYRHVIEQLIAQLRESGHKVFCALEHTNWSMSELAVPEDEFRKDLEEINACDKLIILLEEKISAGVQIETGYAFAKDKKFETYQIGEVAWSNMAFSRLSGSDIIPVKSVADFAAQVMVRNLDQNQE